jgi:hypothetical protein
MATLTKVYLIIPFSNFVRIDNTSPAVADYNLFDRDVNTNFTYTGTNIYSGIIKFDEGFNGASVYIQDISPGNNWGSANKIAVRGNLTTHLITSAPTAVSEDCAFTYASNNIYCSSGIAGTANDILIPLAFGEYSYYQFSLVITNPSGLTFDIQNCIFGNVYTLPMYNSNYEINYSFQKTPFGAENLIGVKNINYNLARINQCTESWTISWTFYDGEILAYKDSMDAFLGRFAGLNMPFGLLVIDSADKIVRTRSGLFIFAGDPTISYDESLQEWNYKLSLIRLQKES